jgi:N-acetylglutamate synthase-like GNAT family acetyltransferase
MSGSSDVSIWPSTGRITIWRTDLEADFPILWKGALQKTKKMIRECRKSDFNRIAEIINEAAQAYKGVISEDRWNEPYMSLEELKKEIEEGVLFWGLEEDGRLLGVMGIQDRGDVTLIRHAYVSNRAQKMGIGAKLLEHLETLTEKPILIGTWAAASWAIAFYEKNGYRRVTEEEKNRLLRKYWSIPERQVETSVVLANPRWFSLHPISSLSL